MKKLFLSLLSMSVSVHAEWPYYYGLENESFVYEHANAGLDNPILRHIANKSVWDEIADKDQEAYATLQSLISKNPDCINKVAYWDLPGWGPEKDRILRFCYCPLYAAFIALPLPVSEQVVALLLEQGADPNFVMCSVDSALTAMYPALECMYVENSSGSVFQAFLEQYIQSPWFGINATPDTLSSYRKLYDQFIAHGADINQTFGYFKGNALDIVCDNTLTVITKYLTNENQDWEKWKPEQIKQFLELVISYLDIIEDLHKRGALPAYTNKLKQLQKAIDLLRKTAFFQSSDELTSSITRLLAL